MQILHFIDPFLFELFGLRSNNLDELKVAVTKFYTIGGTVPTVAIRENLLIVEISIGAPPAAHTEFDRAVELCNKGQFDKAKALLVEFLKNNPTHSEANRILGQIYSDEGNQERAQDFLIEALKWNPKNHWALIMMGNILSNYRKDIAASQKYFEQARKVQPNDHLVLNNIGGNLLKLGKTEEAKDIFWDAVKIKDDYPNTHYALALIANTEGDLQSSFFSAIKALKCSQSKDSLYEQALGLSFQIAQKIVEKAGGGDSQDYAQRLRDEFHVNISIEEDETIGSPAILQLAELHNRTEHTIRFKKTVPTHEHWIIHELVILKFILQAKNEGKNLRFATDEKTEAIFRKKISADFPEKILQALYVGINQQIYNTPSALFAEHEIYQDFSELRAHQYISLYMNLREGISASVDKRIQEMTPEIILSVNRIYNLLKAFQFKDFYGVDLVSEFQATNDEIRKAHDMFREFTEYRDEKNTADEYTLLERWAKHLEINDIFKLIPESESSSENYAPDSEHQKTQMEQFQKSAAETGFNMAVVMYMVDALQHFSGMGKDVIKKAAMEIAMLGMQGISPEKQGYKVNAVPGKSFSGYHLLAYYYVTFALVLPEMLSQLGLPYHGEYAMAQKMAKK